MKLLKENRDGIVVITLEGEFDAFVIKAFNNEITKILEEGTDRIVLNLGPVKFVNSTALGSILRAHKECARAGGSLVVSQPSVAVRDAMQSLGLDRHFSICATDDEAIAALQGEGAVDIDPDSASAVMIHIPESTRTQVAKMTRLDSDSLECRLNKPPDKLVHGRTVQLKFRLPLYRKEYFEPAARIEAVESGTAGTTLAMRFTEISPDDQAAIESFVADMNELRRAARGQA
jgi:anti-anti-sigma factor